jgi:hypothetical protein
MITYAMIAKKSFLLYIFFSPKKLYKTLGILLL